MSSPDRPWERENPETFELPEVRQKKGNRLAVILVAIVLAPVALIAAVFFIPWGDSDEHEVSAETAASEGWEWPLTVDNATVFCGGNGRLVLNSEGTNYALNGLAKGDGLRDLNPIWKDDPDVSGLKIDAGGLTEWATQACGY